MSFSGVSGRCFTGLGLTEQGGSVVSSAVRSKSRTKSFWVPIGHPIISARRVIPPRTKASID